MKLLMCPPDYFDVSYEINPWMNVKCSPDRDLSRFQWDALFHVLTEDLSVDVMLIPPQPGLPDMVFTANAGLTRNHTFVPARFRYLQRAGEEPHFRQWFADNGYFERPLDKGQTFEGEGDALFYGDYLLAGFGPRSDAEAYDDLGKALNCPVIPLCLTDSRWYHLDTCLIPLGDDLLAFYPGAFDQPSLHALYSLPGRKIILTEADALNFGGNAIVVDNNVVVNSRCSALVSALLTHGYRVHELDLSEFIKAGGSAKCLALVLR